MIEMQPRLRFREAFYRVPLSTRLPVFLLSSVATSVLVQALVKGF